MTMAVLQSKNKSDILKNDELKKENVELRKKLAAKEGSSFATDKESLLKRIAKLEKEISDYKRSLDVRFIL